MNKKEYSRQVPKLKAFVLEPILTPSGLPIDIGEETTDLSNQEVDLVDDFDIDAGTEVYVNEIFDTDVDNVLFISELPGDLDFGEDPFTSGVFTVGDSGEVTVDFLFDGGRYEGELAIFSLDGMDKFEPGSEEFIQEAARRALSDSELGHIVIRDRTEGARFSGTLGEAKDWNRGDYLGAKTFQMRPGDEFGVMLVPNSTVEKVFENPDVSGRQTPLFSMSTANPDDAFHVGQLVDVTGDGNTFVLEDQRMDLGSDKDYNDLIFQVRGATGKATLLDEVVDPADDWRNTTDLGQALVEYAKPYITPDIPEETEVVEPASSVTISDQPIADTELISEELPSLDVLTSNVLVDAVPEDQPLIGIIDTGFNGNNPDIDYSNVTLGSDRVDGDLNPFLAPDEGNEHGTHILGLIAAEQDNGLGIDGINDNAPVWIGRGIGAGTWAESLIEFVDAAQESSQPTAIANLSLDLTQVSPTGEITTRYEFTPMEMAALEYARQNNVLVVVAAGNDGAVMSALGQASQQFDNIVTVGAAETVREQTSVWQGMDRANYSSYGDALTLVADGGTLEAPTLSTIGEGVGTMYGTSVATATVTGAASQVWAANPDLSYRQVIEILQTTATDLNAVNPDPETGAGFLNLAAAVHLARATQGEPYTPDLRSLPTTWSGEGIFTPMERAARYPYEMKDNESLWGIAQRELGDGSRWRELTRDAAGQIPFQPGEVTNLPIGQVVYIPGANPTPAPTPNPVTPVSPEAAREAAFNAFLSVFNRYQSAPWLDFIRRVFDRGYTQPETRLNPKAPEVGPGTAPVNPGEVSPQQMPKTLSGKKILLDPGHGISDTGFDPGAVGNGTTEAVENLHQANLVARHLRQLGATVTVLDEALSLAQIGQRAAGQDLFVSLHQNAFNDRVQGHEVLSQPGSPPQNANLAQAINSELDNIFPDAIIPNRGTKTMNLGVLRNAPATVPAVLVESLFIDAPGMSRANVEKAATAVARGIEKFFTGAVTGSVPNGPVDNVSPEQPGITEPLGTGTVNANVGSIPLNFRTEAFVGATILGTLPRGTTMQVLKSVTGGNYTLPGTNIIRNDWYQVTVNGQTGYVAAYYVDLQSNTRPLTVRLRPGNSNLTFGRGQEWITSTGYKFIFQGDGNLVLYSPAGQALWATGTETKGADRFVVQADGNVVLYAGTKPLWATDTAGNPGSYFAIQGDGNLVVYSASGKPIYASGTDGGRQQTRSASHNWLNKEQPINKPGYVNSPVGLNFRSAPTVGSNRLRTLPNGTSLTILSKVGGGVYQPNNRTDWYKVKVGNQTGYVAAYYVKEGTNNPGGNPSPSGWQNPLPGYPVTSEYGPRGSSFHYGIDIGAPSGTPVRSALPGTVTEVGFHSGGWGRFVRINHNGFQTIYAHLSAANVTVGQTVNGETVIGKVGSTGFSTGPHLHFETRVAPYRWKTDNRNPRNYINF